MAKKQGFPNHPEEESPRDHVEELTAQLREQSEKRKEESAPSARGSLWAPKEIGGRAYTRIIRGLSLLLFLIIAIESYFIYQKIQEKPKPGTRGVPTIEPIPAPAIDASVDEPVEIVPYPADETGNLPTPPPPTPIPTIPLPDDLEVDIAPPEE